jgi:hypothetical protein
MLKFKILNLFEQFKYNLNNYHQFLEHVRFICIKFNTNNEIEVEVPTTISIDNINCNTNHLNCKQNIQHMNHLNETNIINNHQCRCTTTTTSTSTSTSTSTCTLPASIVDKFGSSTSCQCFHTPNQHYSHIQIQKMKLFLPNIKKQTKKLIQNIKI